MAIFTESLSNILYLSQFATAINGKTVPYYGSVQDANNYFDMRLYSEEWFQCDLKKQIAALADASRRIDRLNFIGERAVSDQFLEFPRLGQTVVPSVINEAVYELALMMLNGVEPDTEAGNLSTVTRGYGAMKTEFDRSFVPLHVKAGIPSQTAWNLIYPYLRSRDTIVLNRV